MILQHSSPTFHFHFSPSSSNNNDSSSSSKTMKKRFISNNYSYRKFRRKKWILYSTSVHKQGEFINSTTMGAQSFVFDNRVSSDVIQGGDDGVLQDSQVQLSSKFTTFQEDPIVDKLRTQMGVIHPIPSPPINRNVAGLFVFFFFVGVVFDKVWTFMRRRSRRRNKVSSEDSLSGVRPQVPTSFSLFLEKDLQRKESVEWVNMVLGKLWKVYRGGLENWIIGLLQPVLDDLEKPDYVERVEIKQFELGDEPLSVRSVERLTSRRVNDLQYQIGLRYTGGARMLLSLSMKSGIIPIVVPVGAHDFDIDGEIWVKLRLIPTEPWVGAASWAFVSLPKMKFELSPFRLFNLMSIPVLSMFLTKMLTVDLPRQFVRPNRIILDFLEGTAVGPVTVVPVADRVKSRKIQDGNMDPVGELSVTLVDARKVPYFFGKTDPYVILSLGDQTIRSKKNSQTTVIGPPGMPIWNQDFHMLVSNPKEQKLSIHVKDAMGFADLTIGTGEVDLGSLQDTVPTDRIVVLQRGLPFLGKVSAGEILLRLTYKAYVEDEEDDNTEEDSIDIDTLDDGLSVTEKPNVTDTKGARDSAYQTDQESFMDNLAALIVSEEFQGIVASDTGFSKDLDINSNTGSKVSKSPVANAESIPSTSDNSKGSGGSALFWLSVITIIALLIAVNISGSSFFNP